MKKLISLLLCLLLLTGCAETYDGPTESKAVLSKILTTYYDPTGGDSQYGRTDYAYDIYGNQVMELEYRIRTEDETEEPYLKTLRAFDENGNITRQRQYDVSGLFPKKLVDIRYEYRDDCTIQYNYDGTKIVTTYNTDGSEHYRYYTDSTDHITKSSMCYYTEIQVPAEEVSP